MSQHPPISPDNGHSGEWQNAEAVATILMPQQAQQMKALVTFVTIILDWLSGSVEPFIRFDFGERYFGVLRILFTLGTMQLFMLIIAAIISLQNRVSDALGGQYITFTPLNRTFITAFIVLSIVHRLRIAWREWRKPGEWFSYSFGICWIEYIIDIPAIFKRIGIPFSHMSSDWFLYRWVEPAVVYLIASRIYSTEPITGTWLQISAIALFIKNELRFYGYYNAVLDARDAAILAKVIHAAVHGEDLPKSETFGVTAVRQAAEATAPATPAIYKQAQASVNQILKIVKPTNQNGDGE